jgi:hypothetical protein
MAPNPKPSRPIRELQPTGPVRRQEGKHAGSVRKVTWMLGLSSSTERGLADRAPIA